MKTFVIFLSLFVAALLSSGCAITHKFDPYFGKVVDAEIMQPIEGAVVAMVYYSKQYGSPGGPSNDYADAQETTTDVNGEFRLPAMRIITFRPLSAWSEFKIFRIFKSGYGCYPLHKDVQPGFDYGSIPANEHVTIKLPRLTTEKERVESTHCSLSSEAPYPKAMRLMNLINEERKKLGLGVVQYK